jgi:hypothetical protein
LIKYKYLSNKLVNLVNFKKLADFYAYNAKSKLAFGKLLGLLEINKAVCSIVAIVKLALD